MSLIAKNALEKKRLEEEVNAYHKNLELLVEERTGKLQHAYQILKKAHLDSVKVLAEAIDAKDPYTRGHSDRVRKMSIAIAAHLGFAEDQLESLEYGALLHDIGKIGIKDEILQKVGADLRRISLYSGPPLNRREDCGRSRFFQRQDSDDPQSSRTFRRQRLPGRTKGEDIPLEARIIAVPDALDAMTSMRPHREAMSLEEVLSEMERCNGTQFDPEILNVFVRQKIYRI